MTTFDFENLQYHVNRWYRERVREELPVLSFVDLPKDIWERIPSLEDSLALSNSYDLEVDSDAFSTIFQEAAQELRESKKYESAVVDSTLDDILNYFTGLFEPAVEFYGEFFEFSRQFPKTTILIFPPFYKSSLEDAIYVIVHEAAHQIQYMKDLMRKYLLSKEGVANTLKIAYQVQHSTPGEVQVLAEEIDDLKDSVGGTELEIAIYGILFGLGTDATLNVLGIKSSNLDQLRHYSLQTIFEENTYRAIERKVAYEVLRLFVELN